MQKVFLDLIRMIIRRLTTTHYTTMVIIAKATLAHPIGFPLKRIGGTLLITSSTEITLRQREKFILFFAEVCIQQLVVVLASGTRAITGCPTHPNRPFNLLFIIGQLQKVLHSRLEVCQGSVNVYAAIGQHRLLDGSLHLVKAFKCRHFVGYTNQ
jgi:hypothetical protein